MYPKFTGTVSNCYESHVHWRGTGQWARGLRLHSLRAPQELRQFQLQPEYFQAQWLIGCGWNQNQFPNRQMPTRLELDKIFPQTPVCLTRADGHAVWVNTCALKIAGLDKNLSDNEWAHQMLLDANGYSTGVFLDQAMDLIKKHIPEDSDIQIKGDLLAAQKKFHSAGFTHIRDLTCDRRQWAATCNMAEAGELKMAVEQFFSADHPHQFQECLRLALEAKEYFAQNPNPHFLLRPKGMKIYYDGALGSEGALISQPYISPSSSTIPPHFGLRLWPQESLEEFMTITFENDLALAVHAIGDQATHEVISMAHRLDKKGIRGELHLEHAELVRSETMDLIKNLDVVCHMQPCQWLSDKAWLQNKIGSLVSQAFRWKDLEAHGARLYFGSDTPIEPISLQRTLDGVADAADNKIPLPMQPPTHYHQHPDSQWAPQTYSKFVEGVCVEVVFCEDKIKLN